MAPEKVSDNAETDAIRYIDFEWFGQPRAFAENTGREKSRISHSEDYC